MIKTIVGIVLIVAGIILYVEKLRTDRNHHRELYDSMTAENIRKFINETKERE